MKQLGIIFLISLCSHFSYSQSDTIFAIFFNTNKFQVSKLDAEKMVAEFSGKNYLIKQVSGFADTAGSLAYNLKLSERRAASVNNFLLGKGFINPGVKIFFYGEEKSGNHDTYFDRRVEILYEKPKRQINEGRDTTVIPEVSEVYELSNIYFIPDKAVIESFSIINVEEAARYLKTLKNCRFEIVGHVNAPISETALNIPDALVPLQKLSEDRAKTVFDLLAEKGISTGIMSYRGASNTQMIFKQPKNEEEMRKNMRVEILIYCNKFP